MWVLGRNRSLGKVAADAMEATLVGRGSWVVRAPSSRGDGEPGEIGAIKSHPKLSTARIIRALWFGPQIFMLKWAMRQSPIQRSEFRSRPGRRPCGMGRGILCKKKRDLSSPFARRVLKKVDNSFTVRARRTCYSPRYAKKGRLAAVDFSGLMITTCFQCFLPFHFALDRHHLIPLATFACCMATSKTNG
jgi:hypothetical protein